MTSIAKFRHLVGISLAMWACVDDFPSPPMAMPDIAIDAGTSLNARSRGESEPIDGTRVDVGQPNQTAAQRMSERSSRDDDSERTAVDAPSINDTANNMPTMGGRDSRPMTQAGDARAPAPARDAGLMSGGASMGPMTNPEADNRRIDDRVILDGGIVDDADAAVDAPDMDMADAAPMDPPPADMPNIDAAIDVPPVMAAEPDADVPLAPQEIPIDPQACAQRGVCHCTGEECDVDCNQGRCDMRCGPDTAECRGTCGANSCDSICGERAHCDLGCNAGQCKLNCRPGSTCAYTCNANQCNATCAAGANCAFTCNANRCTFDCAQAESCSVTCGANECTVNCGLLPDNRCQFDCEAGRCNRLRAQ